jgi:RNA polymerase sigma factor (TIGR02999 family)
MTAGETRITLLLKQWSDGDRNAESQLYSIVYGELRRLAGHYMRREQPGHTLRPTALVNEAYLRLVGGQPADFQNRKHFFYLASQVMRHILVDHARSRLASKRGGSLRQVTLDDQIPMSDAGMTELLAVHEALEKLSSKDPRKARIVQLRYFAGLSVEETAAIIGTSEKTVKRDWSLARLWLQQELAERPS